MWVKRVLAPAVPYITVGPGLLIFHSGWVAMLGYHLAMVAVVMASGERIPLRRLFEGRGWIIPLALVIAGSLGGVLLYLLSVALDVPGGQH